MMLRRFASLLLPLCLAPALAVASSHSEAPGTTRDRVADDTDLYAFVSPDAPNTVTFVGNWIPLLEPNAGPNFYAFDDQAHYYLNIDNVGDAVNHIRYEFEFTNHVRNGNTFLYNVGPVNSLTDANLNVYQTYTVTRIDNGSETVIGRDIPVAPANVGPTSMPHYAKLAAEAVYTLADGSKVFAGPRDDPFFVDLGAIFDLLTIRRIPGDRGRGRDGVAGYNVMTIALQVPATRLTRDGMAPSNPAGNSILGIHSSTERLSMRTLASDGTVSVSGPEIQVSRLGMPLVNEVVIPLSMKDRFNASSPLDDGQFLSYVTNPELAGLFHAIYGLNVPPAPRNDLVAVFLTGVPGLNQPPNVVPSEQLRLNMAIPPTAKPNRFGVIAGDLGGFPNGRRLGDDVVDIAERVVAGVLVPGFGTGLNARLGDGVDFNDRPFLPNFPYVAPPFSGYFSPHAARADRDGRTRFTGLDRDGDSEDALVIDTVDPGMLQREAGGDEAPVQTALAYVAGNGSNSPGLVFTLARPARVALRVYDVQGREVRTLVDQDADAGSFRSDWDGRMNDGSTAGKGIYFARFTANGQAAGTRKIVLP